jgi:hypothetical protein
LYDSELDIVSELDVDVTKAAELMSDVVVESVNEEYVT